MPAVTPHGFPYPLPTEPVAEGAAAIRSLAEAADALAMVKIADVKVTTAQGEIDFPGIPQTFAHLRIVAALRSNAAANFGAGYLRVNGDAAGSYINQRLRVNVAAITAFETINDVGMHLAVVADANTGGLFGPLTVDLPNYRDPGQLRTALMFGTFPSARGMEWDWGIWTQGAPVTRLTLTVTPTVFLPGSRATLYGLP